MEFSEWFSRCRKASGLSQRALAKALSLSQGTISQYENGVIKPDLPRLLQFAVYFKASLRGVIGPGTSYPGELIEDEGELFVIHAFRDMLPEQRRFFVGMIRGALADIGRATEAGIAMAEPDSINNEAEAA